MLVGEGSVHGGGSSEDLAHPVAVHALTHHVQPGLVPGLVVGGLVELSVAELILLVLL